MVILVEIKIIKLKTLSLLSVLLLTGFVYSQKIKITKGSWNDLKGVKEYNLIFDYENLEVIDYDSEEAFLKEKMEAREKKEAGGGEKFKNSWLNDRQEYYEPDFINGFNGTKKRSGIDVDKDLDTKYTMKVETRKIYPGYYIGIKL